MAGCARPRSRGGIRIRVEGTLWRTMGSGTRHRDVMFHVERWVDRGRPARRSSRALDFCSDGVAIGDAGASDHRGSALAAALGTVGARRQEPLSCGKRMP